VVVTLTQQHTKLLLVTWKDLKGEISLLAQGDVVPLDHAEQILPTTKATFPDFLWEKLAPVIDTQRLVITHYQSGQTRATSAFADCDAVLFVGYFAIPSSVIEEYNKVNRSPVTQQTYLMAEVVQGILTFPMLHFSEPSCAFSADTP
jgi:hypothetical protein